MLLARTNSGLARRRGAILLIVLTLVALFAVVGLSFALYAEAEALGARTRREAKATSDDPPPADAMASLFLREMLYSSESGAAYGTGNAILKSTRGTEHFTMVYGDNPTAVNTIPYNGIGTFSDILTNLPTSTGAPIATLDRRNVINHGVQVPRDVGGNIIPNSIHVVDPSHTEFRNSTQLGLSPGNAASFPTKAYVARNAPYTYPDRLNAYVAVQDPATGRILVPSYHRPSLFTQSTPPFTLGADYSLSSNNPNWRDQATGLGAGDVTGRYKILRPRPWDHRLPGETENQSQFPFPPANADGTVTGDVQNIAQTDGVQRNDSVWIDMGLPMIQWRGRNLQPLIAAAVLPLDGRVNVNVAGNTKNSSNQGSTQGFGPWEIGLSKITSDASTMVNARATLTGFNPSGATGLTSHRFAPGVTQAWGAVNWDAGTTTSPMTLPTANQSDPTFGTSGFDFTTTANATTESDRHPGLFNPYSWNAFTTPGKLFAHTDLRRASHKYAGKPYDYNAPFFGATAPTTLTGTGPGNQSNQRRALLTTASNSLARAGLMPNFADYTALTGPLELNATGQLGYPIGLYPPTLSNPLVVGANSDFAAALNMRHAKADLGPVDLNRTLADYRAPANPTGALSTTNMTNAQAATNDRQTLARDIFVRLILATGAKAVVNPAAGTLTLPRMAGSAPNYDLIAPGDTTPAQYNALRYLAQLAANIVDTVDNDDVATTFVWNPITVTSLYAPDGGFTDMQTYFALPPTMQPERDAYMRDRVVLGVEKPRVVMNEVYSEVTNAPSDSGNPDAASDFHVRFWIELINTANTGSEATAALGDGSVSLSTAGSTAYKIQVFQTASEVRSALYDPASTNSASNITGRVDGLPSQRIDALLPTTAAYTIDPNNGTSGTGTTTGFRVVGPDLMGATATSAGEFIPNTGAAPYATGFIPVANGTSPPAAGGMPSTTLAYQETKRQPADIAGMTINRLTDHAVVLRRLANPYQIANDPFDTTYNPMQPPNPYVTVDVFNDVTSRDAIRIGERVALPGSGMRPAGEPPMPNTRSSKGRLAPHYAHRTPIAAGADTAGFVAAQTMPDALAAPGGQLISFFNHNNQRNGAQPIEWLAHFDRPLINQTELSLLAGGKPHELTYRFVTGTAAAPTAHSHAASFASTTVPLYRALELLTVKPWGYGLPAEGRVPGKININMIWSQSVLEALLDQNAGNTFSTTDVTTLWGNIQGTTSDTTDATNYKAYARTKATGTVGPTFDEVGATYTDSLGVVRGPDRPFKPFGTASFAAGGILPGGSGLADTLLRDGATTGTPAIFPTTATITHPYQKAEMLRKMFNNVTTTSDTYLVVMTVGFFEVRNTAFPISPTNPVVLGKEVSDQSSGDLRGKFVAIVDRSMMGIDITNQHVDGLWQTTINEPPYQVGGAGPYYLRFAAQGVHPINGNLRMLYEGREIFVPAGTQIMVGTGANAEPMTVAAYGGLMPDATPAVTYDTATGLATVTIGAPPAKLHQAGAAASNAILQNPGPQPNFDVNNSRYKGVVPYFEKVEIGK